MKNIEKPFRQTDQERKLIYDNVRTGGIMMAQHIFGNKKSQITFQTFLSGMPARDYVFQNTPYREQIRRACDGRYPVYG